MRHAKGLLALLALLAPAAAAAQEQGNSAEVVVTAQKRAQNLQDVPIAVSVLSGEQLPASASTIEDITTLVPSLTFNKGGTTLNSSLFLRGVGTINFSIAAEPSVAYVLDGVVLARSGEAFGDLYDIERIEVLRGPQGTLFGKNASAGVINVVSRKPGDTFGGTVEVSAFEDNEYKSRIAVDAPITDTLATRITGFVGSFDGTIRNAATGEDLNGYDRFGLRAVTLWEPAPNIDLTIIGDYRKSDDDCCIEVVGTPPTGANAAALLQGLEGVSFEGDETRVVRSDAPTRTEETAWGVSVQGDYFLSNGFTLTSITAYRAWDNTEFREGDWTTNVATYPGTAFASIDDFGPQESSTFSQEVRLVSPEDQRFAYVVGGYFYFADADRTFRRNVTQCLAPPPGGVADATGLVPCGPGATIIDTFSEATFGSEFTNLALFGDATFALTDRLDLIGGLRFTRDELSFYHDRIPAPQGGLAGVRNDGSGFRNETEEEDLSGRAGFAVQAAENINAYATYTRGYKGPAFNVFFNQNANQTGPIDAETADAYEVGLKTDWFAGRLVLNAAAFYAEYENFQANSPTNLNGTVVTQLTNAGTVSTKGVELDWLAQPTDTFTITGGIAYTDAQIEEFRDAATGELSSAREGEVIPFAPEWKGTIAADWRIEPQALPFLTRINANYSYTDEQLSSLGATGFTPQFVNDAYSQVNASLTFSDRQEQFSVSLIGRNLTDESYSTLVSSAGNLGALLFRVPRDADRYFGVSITSKFGG